ncbi:DMT family transporter [Neoroseomonas soli]|uniref:DMT family transporter n=1 Tax=Neoroseomonas soli TaxID=1081025 RepID=A0A9X9X4F4_9PROT|nr:DMT family transporter [Neoroseomonas soli]MBR0674283.1 DMT family transporter [Neoroseomonas soli]
MPEAQTPSAENPAAIPLQAALGLIALVVVWGLSIPLTKLALAETGPLTLTALRYVAAVICFAGVLAGRPVPPPRALLRMALLGALGIGIGQVAQALGVERANASVATIISALIPLLVVVFAVIRLRQRIRPAHVLGLLLAILGVALVAGGGPEAASGFGFTGEALVLLSAISIALSYVMLAELTVAHGAAVVSAWSSLAGLLLLLPAAGWELSAGPRWPGPTGIAVVIYLGAFVSAAGLWLWLYLLRVLPARIAAGAQYFQPLVGVGASAWLFGDVLGLPFAIGTGLILGGVMLTTLPMKR